MKRKKINILTAKEFCKKRHKEESHTTSWIDFNEKVMIEFAAFHVEAALKEASEKATMEYGDKIADGHYERFIDKDSILNSYSIQNIK